MSEETTHTDGAGWHIEVVALNSIDICSPDKIIAQVVTDDELTEEDFANAHLLAAAPHLYEMLEQLTDEYENAIETHIYDGDEPEGNAPRRMVAVARELLARAAPRGRQSERKEGDS